jgi:hypothetical protein
LKTKRRMFYAAATAALVTAGTIVGITSAGANVGASTFGGGDGNLVAPDANGTTDWLTPPPNLSNTLDLNSGQTDNSFGNGTKEDDVNVTVGLGSIPNNKADLRRQMIAGEVINGQLFLYLAATRASTSGTVNYDFEINQKAQPNLTTPGPKTLNRTVGDLLVTYDFAGGAQKPTLSIRTWSGSVWGAPTALNSSNSEGDVNRVGIPPAQGMPGDNGYAAFTFAEASINLTSALNIPPGTCENFAAASTHSRASDSFSAAVKDFIAPAPVNINNCGTVKITKATENGDSTFNYSTSAGLDSSQAFTLTNGQTKTYSAVAVGNHSVTENLTAAQITAGWTLKNLACTNSGGATSSTSGATANITMVGGGEVDCTYTNHINLSPTIATQLSADRVSVGDPVHDSATLTGATANAGGTVKYSAYAGANNCTGTDLLNSTVNVTNGAVPNSADFTPTDPGTYSFQAVYSGDGNNNPATSDCSTEQLLVKNSPTVTTTLSQVAIVVGNTVTDSATLNGATANAGGTVTYTVYDNSTCTSNANDRDAGTKTVTNGTVPDSDTLTFNQAGDFYWQAAYSGDANNDPATSSCAEEHLVVNKASPTIATVLSAPTIEVGGSVSDSATLTGASSDAGGSATYTVYTDDQCTAGARDAGTKTVVTGVVPDSNALAFNTAGTFYWQVHYSGDANNNPADSACQSEVLVVSKAKPAAATAQSIVPQDHFTLSGGFNPTGTVTMSLFDPSDASCSGTPAFTQDVAVNGNSTYDTTNDGSAPDGYTATAEGTYRWKSHYSGDSNNEAADSACGVEQFTLTNH